MTTHEHPNKAEVERLEAEIQRHPGTAAMQTFTEASGALVTWQKNSADLTALLRYGETDAEMVSELMRNAGDTGPRENYLRALDLHIQDFAQSLVALIDRSGRILQQDASAPFVAAYEVRNSTVRALDGAGFIIELGSYLLHHANSPFSLSGRLIPEPAYAEVALDAATLLAGIEWTASTSTYIEAHPDGVRLSLILPAYVHEMNHGIIELLDDYGEFHESEFSERNELVRQRNLALAGGANDGGQRANS
jgi:hypothetical protein